MREFLVNIIKKIVDNPESVTITEKKGSQGFIFEVTVTDRDKGKVIGKQGRTIKAIRNLMSTIGRKQRESKIDIEIID